MAQLHAPHVAPWKKDEVADLVRLLREYPVIGIASIGGIPAAQMVKMRKSLRQDAEIKVVKNTLLVLALREAARDVNGIDKLVEKMEGPTAVIATKMNPFRLYKKLESSKTKAPAKGGETAPEDIVIHKGETPFKPGPIVGDLQKAGIPAKIDQGKVVIASDKVLVKAGAKIPQDVAQALTRLEIFPLIVGMDVRAVYETGMVYGRDVLAVDEVEMMNRLQSAAASGFNLAVFVTWTTKDTIKTILAKAHREAAGVSLEAAYPAKGLVDLLIAKGHRHMLAVGGRLSAEAQGEKVKAALAAVPVAAAAAPAAKAAKPAEKEEEKGPTEEEAMSGLGSLFG